MTNKLDIAKEVIIDNIAAARCGIYDCRNLVGDPMHTLYWDNGLCIDICYTWGYFEVFGLTDEEFKKLEEYYERLCKSFKEMQDLMNRIEENLND